MEINLEQIVNHRVSILAVLMKRHILKILAERELKVTPDQWVVMYYLWQENGLSVGEISRRSKKDFANVTRIVDKLVYKQYVDKRRSQKDSRIYNVYILPKGDAIKNEIQTCWKQASDIALQGINLPEQQQMMETLTKIEKNILNSIEQLTHKTKQE